MPGFGRLRDAAGQFAQIKAGVQDPASIANAVQGIAGSKLSGTARDVFELGTTLFRQLKNAQGNTGFSRNANRARDPLKAAISRPDALTSIYWYVDLPVIDTMTLGWEYVEEVTLPFLQFETTSNFQAGKMKHYPLKVNLDTMNLKLFESVKGTTTQYFSQWASLVRDPTTGLFKLPALFKKPIRVTVLDISNMTVMFLEYTGCWPTRIDAYGMQSSQAERVQPSVEMSVDDLVIKFGSFPAESVPSVIDSIGTGFPQSVSRLPSVFPKAFAEFDLGSLPI